jgi:carbamoyltransferase
MKILGLNVGHDAAAALAVDGKLVADVAEERFSRVKNDCSFPLSAIDYCFRVGGISSEDLDCIALPTNDLPEVCRLLFRLTPRHEALRFNYGSSELFIANEASNIPKNTLPLYLQAFLLSPRCKFFIAGHHAAHAASAFYTSGAVMERSLVATLDGAGGGASITIWRGEQGALSLLQKYSEESSLGWFYSNVTEALGWRHSSDEWKVMGLAPYGIPNPGALKGFHPEFQEGMLVEPYDYGKFTTWPDHGSRHYHGKDAIRIAKICEKIGRENLAAEAQRVVEEQVLRLILPWLEKENTSKLICAGGFFLNVKVNQRLWESGKLSFQWIYPNPGDAGLAAGAALLATAIQFGCIPGEPIDHLSLGPEFSTSELAVLLKERGLVFREVSNPAEAAIPYLRDNRVVGWFQGRMESGPRALGNRSILMSPQKTENKDIINTKVKFREAFRPFCPSILAEKANQYFLRPRDERFMLSSFSVREEARSAMPAVVHVDGSARPQLVHRRILPLFHELIDRFGESTGVHALLNTSFNIKGEPIVCTPREAIRTFFDTGLDVLVIDRFVVEKPYLSERAFAPT